LSVLRLGVTIACAMTILAAAPLAAAEKCVIDSGGNRIEYDCAAGRDGGGSSEPWWASPTAQAGYAFFGLVASGAGGGYAFMRVKRRREMLAAYMHRIDETLVGSKANPAAGAASLGTVRGEMRTAFQAGKLDDAHYLELDKRAVGAILKLRLLELDQRFPQLPVSLRSQIATLVGDGKVSSAEVELVRTASASAPIPGRVRDEVMGLLAAWAAQDSTTRTNVAATAAAPAESPPGRLEESSLDSPLAATPVMVRIIREK
jgi:hypothetical protein